MIYGRMSVIGSKADIARTCREYRLIRNQTLLGALFLTPMHQSTMLTPSPPKSARNRVTLTRDLARRWSKRLGKSADEIEAAVARVGDNAETVKKEQAVRAQSR